MHFTISYYIRRSNVYTQNLLPTILPNLRVIKITDPITELASMLQAMRANADMQEKLAIRDVASRAAEHPDTVVKVAYMLHQTCINDWHKVDNIGELCCYLAAQEPNGQSFRNALLVMLQNEHQRMLPFDSGLITT